MTEFNIGDKVKITGTDGSYARYQAWADMVGSKRFNMYKDPIITGELEVISVAPHQSQNVTLYLLGSDEGEFIFDNSFGDIELVEKKPRTKVEYVKCEFSREWEAVKYYNEEGELFVIDCNGNYSNVNDISGAWYEVVCKNLNSLYRAVHIDIDWRDDAICYFNTTPSLHEDDRLIDLISKSATKQESDAFIKLCHLVSSLNSVN